MSCDTFFLAVGETTPHAVKQLAEDNDIQQYVSAPNLPKSETFELKVISQDDVKRIIMSMPTNRLNLGNM